MRPKIKGLSHGLKNSPPCCKTFCNTIYIPWGMHLVLQGLSHGLKKCPLDTFLHQCEHWCRPFESRPTYQKCGYPNGKPEGTRLHFLPDGEKIKVSIPSSRARATAPWAVAFNCSSPAQHKQKIQIPEWVSGFFGTPEGTRTPNPRNRNPMLYPLSHRRVLVDSLDIIAGFS